jgi:hypothetical protein
MGRREHGLTLFTGVVWFIGSIVVVQLWLVTAALEALLAGRTTVLVPAAVASLALAAINIALLVFVIRQDRSIRSEAGPAE